MIRGFVCIFGRSFHADTLQKIVSFPPQAVRQVDIIPMRMLKPLYLVPQAVHLRSAIRSDISERGQVVNAPALFEYLHQEAFGAEIALD